MWAYLRHDDLHDAVHDLFANKDDGQLYTELHQTSSSDTLMET